MLNQEVFDIEELEIKKGQRLHPVPDDDLWRVGMASEVIDALHGEAFVSEFNMEMLNTFVSHLCRN